MCECGALTDLTSTLYGLLCDACRFREEGDDTQHQKQFEITFDSTSPMLNIGPVGLLITLNSLFPNVGIKVTQTLPQETRKEEPNMCWIPEYHQPPTTLTAEEILKAHQADYDERMRIQKDCDANP